MIIDPEDPVIANFQATYPEMHPLVMHRSLEKASSMVNLFEILAAVPNEGAFSWDDAKRSWVRDGDVMAVDLLKSTRKRGK